MFRRRLVFWILTVCLLAVAIPAMGERAPSFDTWWETAEYQDIFKKTLLPITEMEKLMGKKHFADILGTLVIKPAGKPTLVPISDKRPAITPVNNEFKQL